MCAGFQRVFEDNARPDRSKAVSAADPCPTTKLRGALKSADAIFLGFAGSNGFRFLRQFVDYGLKDKMQVIGGMTALDEAVLRNMGDEALDIVTTCWYSAELEAKPNQTFAPAFRKEFNTIRILCGEHLRERPVLEAAVKAVNGKVEDRPALMAALRATNGRHRAGTCQV